MDKRDDTGKRESVSETMLRALDVGVSKHLLDDSFTMIWANEAFYRLTGYTEEEFLLRFSDFREYCGKITTEFKEIRQRFLEAFSRGDKSSECRIRIPMKLGKTVWVKITGTFCKSGEGTAAYFLYTDVNDMMLEQEKLHRIKDERKDNFEWMMSEYAGNVYISDIDTYELLYLNKQSCDTLHAPASQLVGRKCYEAIQGRTAPCPFCTNSRLKKEETYEWEFYNPNLMRTFLIKDRLLDWEGHRARIELSYDMYSTEYKLAKKDQEREAILRTIPAGMIRIDARDYRTIIWYNDIFLDMIEYTKEQFEDELHNRCTYLHPDDFKRAITLVKNMNQSGENAVFEARAYTRSREEHIWTVTLCFISGKDSWDGIPSYYSVGLDITEERRQIETLQYRAEKDALTGIYNRAETEKQIKKYLAENPDSMGAMLMIDTDNFKQINDTQGHMIGDVVLSEMAAGMKKLMRDSDVVGRIGGDEFTLFMKNITSSEAAKSKAGELLNMFRHLFENEKSAVKVTCSIGIALYPQDGSTFKEIYGCADKALYQAKTQGKNNYVIYDQYSSEQLKQITYSSLGAAIDSERKYAESPDNLTRYVFRLLYQLEDLDRAVNMVLEIVGKQFDVSRAYIFENTEDGRFGSNTYEWCNEGITPQITELQNSDYEKYGNYERLFDDNLIFYCRDIHTLKPEHVELFSCQGIHSTLQCAYREDSVFKGFVGFDECTGTRLWTQEEVSTLSLISQVLSIFLRQKKMAGMKMELEQYQTILDSFDVPVYVVEAESGALLYGNRKYKNENCSHDCAELQGLPVVWNGRTASLYIERESTVSPFGSV